MSEFVQAMKTLGSVTEATRAKAQSVMEFCEDTLGRSPGVLWGYVADARNIEHHSGRAVDFMTSHNGRGLDYQLGNAIRDHLLKYSAEYNLQWLIWCRRLYYANGNNYLMEDRGSLTNNHYDHVHAYFANDKFTKPAKEDENMAIDYKQLASAILNEPVTRSDGWQAPLRAHIGDMATRMIQLSDGVVPEIEYSDGTHKAKIGEVVGHMIVSLIDVQDTLQSVIAELRGKGVLDPE